MRIGVTAKDLEIALCFKCNDEYHHFVKVNKGKSTYYGILKNKNKYTEIPKSIQFDKLYTNPLMVIKKYTYIDNLKTTICNNMNKRIICNDALFYHDKGIRISDEVCQVNLGCYKAPENIEFPIPTKVALAKIETTSGILYIVKVNKDIRIA